MTYRLRNIVLAVVLAVLAALLTMLYVANYQRNVQAGEEDVKVFVAKQTIPAGTSGSEAARMLEERSIEQRNVVPGAVASPDDVKTLVVSQPIYAGEQASLRRFSSSQEIGVRSKLKGNMRAVQVAGDSEQLLRGTLRAGDRVDVVASLKIHPDKDIHATRIVLRDIEVLRTSGEQTNVRRASSPMAGNLSVLLAVSDTQVQKLFHVVKHGQWSLQLRPVVDAVDSPESVETAPSIMRDGLRGNRFGGNR